MNNHLEPDWFASWFEKTFGPKEAFSPQEVAATLNRSKNFVYRALRFAELEGIRLGKRSYMIPRDALRKWLLEQNVLNVEEG